MREKYSHYNEEPTEKDSREVPSKSAKKREMLALQALGHELAALSEKQFQKIIFPKDNLLDALKIYRSIPNKKREARRRQLQFIGKLMRSVEPEPLQTQVDAVKRIDNADKRKRNQAEQWRERLLADPEQATDFMNQFPTDSQLLNQTIRAAKKAKEMDKDKGEARSLYRLLYKTIGH